MEFEAIGNTLNIKDFKVINKLGGFSSDNYLVTINGINHFLKMYKNYTIKEINRLEQLLIELSEKNLPVISPIIYNKKLHFEYKGATFAIFPFITGLTLHGDAITENLFSSISESIIKINNTKNITNIESDSHSIFGNKTERLSSINDMISYIKENPIDPQIDTNTQNLLSLKKNIIKNIDVSDFKEFWDSKDLVHGDFHNENILFKDNKVEKIVDFELAHWGNKMEDTINFILFAFCNNDFSSSSLNKSKNFLEEYRKIYPFNLRELKFGVEFNIYRFASSIVIENLLYKDKNLFFYELVKRDLKKFKYLSENKDVFVSSMPVPETTIDENNRFVLRDNNI